MSKHSVRQLAIYILAALTIGYLASVYFVYQRMPADQKIYLQIVNTSKSDSVTPIPIPNYIKLLLWERIGGRNDVFQFQKETDNAFLFVMNLMDDAEKNEELELKTVESIKLAQDLFCTNTSEEIIGKYQAFAEKTNNASLKKYLEEFSSPNICVD
jgi:hypothetical protein